MANFKDIIEGFTTGNKTGAGQSSNFQGVFPAIVTNNEDPENRYRVKVKLVQMKDEPESFWARIATTGAGKDGAGMFWLPEVDDEVLVAGNGGDSENLYILGQVWNGTDKSTSDIDVSPQDVNEKMPNKEQGGKNDFRVFRSRTKHHLAFKDREGEGAISLRTIKKNELFLDDTDGAEKIQLFDMDRKQWLEIDIPNKKITLQTDTGEILIKAKDTITMECKDLVIKADKTIKVDSGDTSKWTAKGALTWETKASATYKSSSTTTVKGSKIDLNP